VGGFISAVRKLCMILDAPTRETLSPPEGHTEPAVEASWVVAVLFWGTMLIAGALYALAALSPKLVVYLQLRDEHYQTQVKLVTLERRVMYLKKVMHALEHDPSFAAEQARVELGAERPGEERISVDESLHLIPDADFDPRVFKKSILPWYTPLLNVFGGDAETRRGLLWAASLMSLFAFTFLQESQASQLRAWIRGVRNGWRKATARYRPEAASEAIPPGSSKGT
jgi:cell division protein FtsB